MFKVNYNGVEEAGDYSPAPDGTYTLKVVDVEEAKTRNNDPMVKVTLQIASGPYAGKKVFHNVTFFGAGAPGAGFSKHWLHVIGQPYQGEVTVMPAKWRGARLEADLIIEPYTDKNGASKYKNSLQSLRAVAGENQDANRVKEEAEDGVPF